ncbi:hypothetical protein BD311DRAFT_351968 [Dichomitus squalens]|uniref:Uncharacterized protein n=1 Tax=Dichomitus squalens TaxID=114155 RepID=A0A4V2K1W6_9APHY|nr:hypothetical protein BD311DRAFT_351968 [Dichomitus squalens]
MASPRQLLTRWRGSVAYSGNQPGAMASRAVCVHLVSRCSRPLKQRRPRPLVTLKRMAMKDITLIDGTYISKGTLLAATAHPMHHNEARQCGHVRSLPLRRDARKRRRLRRREKHRCVSTSVDYISFGHGKHAWYVNPRLKSSCN